MKNFFHGFSYLLDGFSLMTKPGLKRFFIIPALINIIFFIGLYFLLRHYMFVFNAWFDHFLPSWLQWLSIILWLLFFVCFFLVFIYLFVVVTHIISAPFNSFLSEKVEIYLTGRMPEERSLMENIKDFPRIIGRQLSIIFYYLPRAILFIILFFVPVVQAFAAVFWFLFNAWFMTMTYIDYPTDNHRIPMKDVHVWLRANWSAAMGFGIFTLLATMIPIVNFFIVPAAVAGATKFWIEGGRRADKARFVRVSATK